MEPVRIKLSALWTARMLTGFLGDVLRFLEPGMMGKIGAGEVGGMRMSQGMLLVSAGIMVLPIAMVFLSLTLRGGVNRWANIILALFFIAFDSIGLPSYEYAYSMVLIVVGILFNALTIWYAWKWRAEEAQRKV